MSRSILALTAILSLGLAGNSVRAEDAAVTPAATDYANPAVWLCRPGRQEACSAPQASTIVAVNAALTHEAFPPPKNPPTTCSFLSPPSPHHPHPTPCL